MHTSDTWVQLNNSEIIRFKFMHVFFYRLCNSSNFSTSTFESITANSK